MTAKVEIIITCDGGEECPSIDSCYAGGDARHLSALTQRMTYKVDGWVFHKKKDYCPACAARLGLVEPEPTN